MMANITKKRDVTRSTFAILGIAVNKELIESLRPWFLEMTLKGLKILNILSILKTDKSTSVTPSEAIENTTTRKSIIFWGFLR